MSQIRADLVVSEQGEGEDLTTFTARHQTALNAKTNTIGNTVTTITTNAVPPYDVSRRFKLVSTIQHTDAS